MTDSEDARKDQAQRQFKEGLDQRLEAVRVDSEIDKPDFRLRPRIKREYQTKLAVYQGECDWVVARDLDDALVIMGEHIGGKGKTYHEAAGLTKQEARDEWWEIDYDSPLSIWTEVADWKFRLPEKRVVYAKSWPMVWLRDEYYVVECAPVWWWIQTQGRGFLCSSET